jgi:hypothetical protein
MIDLDREVNIYINCLLHGVDVQYRRLGLYSMEHIGRRNCWQVHTDDTRCRHSQLYYDVRKAAEKFIELKYKLMRSYGRIKE